MRAFAYLAFAAVLIAETPPRPGTLHSVNIKGNRLYSSEDIVKQTGLKVGQPVSAPCSKKLA